VAVVRDQSVIPTAVQNLAARRSRNSHTPAGFAGDADVRWRMLWSTLAHAGVCYGWTVC
jgi:hypothetical protein